MTDRIEFKDVGVAWRAGVAEHHALVSNLINHPRYDEFFRRLSTTNDPATGQPWFDIGNR